MSKYRNHFFGFLLLLPLAFLQSHGAPQDSSPGIFELAMPDFGLEPTSSPEIEIPSPNATTVHLYVLRPRSDEIDYGDITPILNGEAAARIASVVTTERGKLVKLDLQRLPGFQLVPGRNTIEIRATNVRRRTFYSSFVLRTATENRNEGFRYKFIAAGANLKAVPPELVLLEPENEIVVPTNGIARTVRFYGAASAAQPVASVTVDGQKVPLRREGPGGLRSLGLSNEKSRSVFDFRYAVSGSNKQIVVEATDSVGNRTQLQIPVRERVGSSPARFTGRKFALLIGVSKFKYHDGGLYDLKYADTDARSVCEFLQSRGAGQFAQGDIEMLTNEQATIANVTRALGTFVSQPGADDLLVIFIATHGSPDPFSPQNLYFLAHDTRVDRMPETALAMNDLQTLLQRNVRAKRIVLLVDTCHSGSLTGSGGERSRAIANNLVNLYAEKLLYQSEGRAVITSSDVNETSQESPRWGGGHGVFSYFLLQGLRGKADSDEDSLVTIGELFRYVRGQVRMETQYKQNPRVLVGGDEKLGVATIAAALRQRHRR